MGLWKDSGEVGREKAAQHRAERAESIRRDAMDAYAAGLPVYIAQIRMLANTKAEVTPLREWSEAVSIIESVGWTLSHLPAHLDGLTYTGVAVFRRLPAQ